MEVYYHINLRGKSSVKVDSLDADHRNILIVMAGDSKITSMEKVRGDIIDMGFIQGR